MRLYHQYHVLCMPSLDVNWCQIWLLSFLSHLSKYFCTYVIGVSDIPVQIKELFYLSPAIQIFHRANVCFIFSWQLNLQELNLQATLLQTTLVSFVCQVSCHERKALQQSYSSKSDHCRAHFNNICYTQSTCPQTMIGR